MKSLLNFTEWLIESNKQSSKKTETQSKKWVEKKGDTCPRCNKPPEKCKCQEKDPWSTQTYHRVPKGDTKKSIPKQNFKDDDD